MTRIDAGQTAESQKGPGAGFDPREITTSYADFLSLSAESHKRGNGPPRLHNFEEIMEHFGMRTQFDWWGALRARITIRSLPDAKLGSDRYEALDQLTPKTSTSATPVPLFTPRSTAV
jgi:hypothetical protein